MRGKEGKGRGGGSVPMWSGVDAVEPEGEDDGLDDDGSAKGDGVEDQLRRRLFRRTRND